MSPWTKPRTVITSYLVFDKNSCQVINTLVINHYCFCRLWKQFSYRSFCLRHPVDLMDLNGCHPELQINHLILKGNYIEHRKKSMVYCRIREWSDRATSCSLKRRVCADKDVSNSCSLNPLLQDKPIPERNNKIIEKTYGATGQETKIPQQSCCGRWHSPWTTVDGTFVWKWPNFPKHN